MAENSDEKEQANKAKGNGLGCQESSTTTLEYFKAQIACLEKECEIELESEADRKSSLISSYLNLAVCYMKLQKYSKAIEACNQALALGPRNDQAIFCQAQCYMKMKEFQEASLRFKSVLDIDADNHACRYFMRQCKDEMKLQDQRDIKMCRKMLEKCQYEDVLIRELGEEHIPKRLLGATNSRSGNLLYLMKWKNGKTNMVPSEIINEKSPQLVIQFYEHRAVWHNPPDH